MDQHRIKELIDLLSSSDLSELTLSEGGSTLHLGRQSTSTAAQVAPAPATASVAPAAATEPVQSPIAAAACDEVASPLYGILHLTPAPGEPPFAQVGDSVKAGQTLCIVEAMKMFHQVKATADGRVQVLLAEAGQEVDSGQPLFRIERVE